MGVAIKRKCDLCGKAYTAKSKRSKFCSPACRVRNHEGRKPLRAADPPAPDATPSTNVTDATMTLLVELDRVATPEGQAALVLARKIDAAEDPLSAINGAVKQLSDTLAGLRRQAPKEGNPLDELRARRQARQRGA